MKNLSEFVRELRRGWSGREIVAFQAMLRDEAAAKAASVASATVEQPELAFAAGPSEMIFEMEMQLDAHLQNCDCRRLRLLDVEIENRLCGTRNRRNPSRRQIAKRAAIRRARRTRRPDTVLS